MKIYTRTGDQGATALLGNHRVQKNDLRICAYGTVDELNAVLGVARASGLTPAAEAIVERLQHELFQLGAELASPNPAQSGVTVISAEAVSQLETWIDTCEAELSPLTNFVLPAGCQQAATLHLARCICRRAEREIVALGHQQPVREQALQYVNRLSDLLFVMARQANAAGGSQRNLVETQMEWAFPAQIGQHWMHLFSL